MIEIKETTYKGTRILVGNDKRDYINSLASYFKGLGFTEMQIPIIQYKELFLGKVGGENQKMMFDVKDKSDRELCLAPEYTAVVQQLAKTYYKRRKDVKLFYVAECFRGEKPQAGRYRQFTQFGVEILNPTKDYYNDLIGDAVRCIKSFTSFELEVNRDVTRGLDYYKCGKGFEISIPALGSSKQVCGGGEYDGGIGFAIGVDRLISSEL
jgi:histidyl-tRNA synthetase